MTRFHGPELHLAQRFTAVFERALHHERTNEPVAPPRTTPAAADWDDWHWDGDGGQW